MAEGSRRRVLAPAEHSSVLATDKKLYLSLRVQRRIHFLFFHFSSLALPLRYLQPTAFWGSSVSLQRGTATLLYSRFAPPAFPSRRVRNSFLPSWGRDP